MKWALILVLLLVACSSTQYVCSDGSVVEDSSLCENIMEEKIEKVVKEAIEEAKEPVEEESAEIIEEPELGVVEETSLIDPEVQELFDKAKERTKSIQYVYVGPPENLPRDRYFVRDHLIKVEPMKETDHKLSQPYTHVYISTKKGTAVAYCNAVEQGRCENGFERVGEMDYHKYFRDTPLDWIRKINYAEYQGGGQKFENRETIRIKFRTPKHSGTMRVLEFYGLPAVILLDNGDEIEFRDIIINNIAEADVTEPDWE